MRRRLRVLAALVGATALPLGCGTALPDSEFDSLGSGKAVLSTEGADPAAGGQDPALPAATQAGVPGAPQPAGGATPSAAAQGTAGTKGTAGQTVTTGGKAGTAGQSGTASGCKGDLNSKPDHGVTKDELKIGIIYSGAGNPFAPNQFVVSYHGVAAYVGYINAQGGICGRKVTLRKCDDGGDRNKNVSCARRLIDEDKVLALVGSNVFEYSGASYVASKKVPDIGGQPVSGDAYYTYPHLYSILGSFYENNGQPPKSYWGFSGLGRWFKDNLKLKRVGVIYYAQADSQRGANYIIGWLKNAGIQVDAEQVPLAGDPGPQVQDMKNNGDQAIFDALDLGGNQKVCRAMDNYNFKVPKISTIATWTQDLGPAVAGYSCVNNYYSWGQSTNYADGNDPSVSLFQKAYASFAPGAPLSQWSLEGWAAGMWFADAAKSCGNNVTRECLEKFVDTKEGYAGGGLLDKNTTSMKHWKSKPASGKQCYTIVKWAGGGSGTWKTQADQKRNCFTTPLFDY